MVVPKKVSSAYEDSRKQRLEENKKRMEELNLNKLSKALIKKTTPTKPSPAKKRVVRQPVDPSSIRRSSRVADQPPRSYKEEPIEPLGRARRPFSYNRRNLLNRVYAAEEDRMYATHKAEELQASLGNEFASFVKPMLQSHVTGGFWLGLPVDFCSSYLPKEDEFMTLLDEEGNESSSKYLAEKRGLSAGWRGFAIDHELVDGDALVFQLIKPLEFKVYIIRVNQPNDDDEGIDVLDNEKASDELDNNEDINEAHVPPTMASLRKRARKSKATNGLENDEAPDVPRALASRTRRARRTLEEEKQQSLGLSLLLRHCFATRLESI